MESRIHCATSGELAAKQTLTYWSIFQGDELPFQAPKKWSNCVGHRGTYSALNHGHSTQDSDCGFKQGLQINFDTFW